MIASLIGLARAAWRRLQPAPPPPPAASVFHAAGPVDPDRFPPTEFAESYGAEEATLGYAQEWLAARMDDGVRCPCCTQFTKVYARTLTATMAYALICLHQHTGPEWFHAPSYLSRVARRADSTARGGDWAKLTHWGLIEEAPERREDNCPHTGYYRVTERGRRFVLGQLSVPRWAVIFDGRLLYLDDGRRTTIEEALGKRFNYAELMATSPADLDQIA